MKKDKDGDHDCVGEYAANSGKKSKQSGKANVMKPSGGKKIGPAIGPANAPRGKKKP